MKNTLICLILTIFLFSCKEDENPFSEIYIEIPTRIYIDPDEYINLKIPYDVKYTTHDMIGHIFMGNKECTIEPISDRIFRFKAPENLYGGYSITHDLNGNQEEVIFGNPMATTSSGFYILKKLGQMKKVHVEYKTFPGYNISNGEKVINLKSTIDYGTTTDIYSYNPESCEKKFIKTIDIKSKYFSRHCLSPRDKNIVYIAGEKELYELNLVDYSLKLKTKFNLAYVYHEDFVFKFKNDSDHLYIFYKTEAVVDGKIMYFAYKLNLDTNEFIDIGNIILPEENKIDWVRYINGNPFFDIRGYKYDHVFDPSTVTFTPCINKDKKILYENENYIYHDVSELEEDKMIHFISEFNKKTKEDFLTVHKIAHSNINYCYEYNNKLIMAVEDDSKFLYWIWDINAK